MHAYHGDAADVAVLKPPLICFWEKDHFIVIEGFSRDTVAVVDPSYGRRRLAWHEFENHFGGVVLTATPSEAFVPLRRRRERPWRHFIVGLRTARPAIAAVLLTSLLIQVVGLALPIFTAVAVDRVVVPGRADLLLTLLIGAALITANHAVLGLTRERLLLRLRRRLESEFTERFMRHLFSLPLTFFESRGSGDILARAASNAQVRDTLSNQVTAAFIDGTLVIGYFAIIVIADPTFAVAVLGFFLALLLIVLPATARIHLLLQRQIAARARTQNYLLEVVTAVATVKASAREAKVLRQWRSHFARELDEGLSLEGVQANLTTAVGAIQIGFGLALLLLAAQRVLDGAMTLGTALALAALGVAMLAPVASLFSNIARARRAVAYLERLNDVLDVEPESHRTRKERPDLRAAPIVLDHVMFKYEGTSRPAVIDVSLTIDAGRKLVIVGPTGSGKTTLAKLILGLYKPDAGLLSYADVPADDCDIEWVRRQFGVVLQETPLFDATIAENIAFFDSAVSEREIERAAAIAGLNEDVMQMPRGYATHVSEGGRALSGGQRQRVALARALVSKPAVLVLDEATSHVDPVTERRIGARLRELALTRVVIAHRPSVAADADAVAVVAEGRLVDHGSPREVALRNAYFRSFLEGGSPARRSAATDS